MSDPKNTPPNPQDLQALYHQACELARGREESELTALRARLTDPGFLARLDPAGAHTGPATRLRVAGVLQILTENFSPYAREVLLGLTASPAFLAHRERTALLIQALAKIRPASPQAVKFWDAHCQPDDGYTAVTIWALVDNGSPPAIDLFEKKVSDARFSEDERRYWLTACILTYRNDLSLLQACQRLLQSPLEEPYRLLLVDVLFDYQPDGWYGARHWFKPPLRAKAEPDALKLLQSLGQKALESQPLSQLQREKIRAVMQEVEQLTRGRK